MQELIMHISAMPGNYNGNKMIRYLRSKTGVEMTIKCKYCGSSEQVKNGVV
ncbi:hypothetical protein [Candidatus Midichloria mitochondrii]|uniref:hypothetical protein n=1 Tax=Candidatus Midichloria mitochondrii TaxID=234827 RepID=UPI0002D2EF2C|nr:hypothetical protein [Candidatus Midichloria mitochondrii]MDJ1256472.1 hypothetical protein [Candidatus Midichloria mitochondrii]MDJ1299060.1 hypothetical protein [Candidatus Midichloria mitochondrii]